MTLPFIRDGQADWFGPRRAHSFTLPGESGDVQRFDAFVTSQKRTLNDEALYSSRMAPPRARLDAQARSIRAGRLTVYPDDFVARYGDEELVLTYRQFRLLALFAEHPGRLLRREVIAREVWDGDAPGRSVDIQVSRLRKKLPEGLIRTVVRVGYRYVPEDEA